MRNVSTDDLRQRPAASSRWAARAGALTIAIALASACGGSGGYIWYSDLPKSEWGPISANPPATDYVIGVGDTLSVKVYEQEALSMTGKVRSDGRFALTLIGEITAAGKRPSAVARELEGRFKEFIVSPRVTVNVDASQPVSVVMVGEVSKAGAIALEPPASLLQAMALAGGPSEFADRSRILVIRRFPEFRRIRFTYDSVVENHGGAAAFPLRSGDIVLVE